MQKNQEKEGADGSIQRVVVWHKSRSFWTRCASIREVCSPVMHVLCKADANHPCMGDVYNWLGGVRSSIDNLQQSQNYAECLVRRSELLRLVDERWDFLHNKLYSLAYALNPEYAGMGVLDINEVYEHCQDVLLLHARDQHQHGAMLIELRSSQSKLGRAWELGGEASETLLPHLWWQAWGNYFPLLCELAIRILALCPSAAPCERNCLYVIIFITRSAID